MNRNKTGMQDDSVHCFCLWCCYDVDHYAVSVRAKHTKIIKLDFYLLAWKNSSLVFFSMVHYDLYKFFLPLVVFDKLQLPVRVITMPNNV